MGESLPKGDLLKLLGHVPNYDASKVTDENIRSSTLLPPLAGIDEHPYHIVVVSGQECPTVSGLPRGIGGMGTMMSNSPTTQNLSPLPTQSNSPWPSEAIGWSAMLDDWLCHGGGSLEDPQSPPQPSSSSLPRRPSTKPSKHLSQVSTPHADAYETDAPLPDEQSATTPSLPASKPNLIRRLSKIPRGDERKDRFPITNTGPYELVAKERLMGLYTAVYVYRGCRKLVQGVSKSTVTAGLLGGRFGNKGAVGVR